VLVDADEVAPGHAQRLGLPVHPNLHTAVRAVQSGTAVDGLLHPLAARRPLAALVGMAVVEDWAAVPPAAIGQVLGALAARRQAVVMDLGHCLPRTESLAGLRFGHGDAAADLCDDLVLVTAPTPQAIARAVAQAAQLRSRRGRLHVVLNRVGADRFVRDECIGELRRATGVPQVHVVTEDPRVPRAAWQGTRVPSGRFRTHVGRVAEDLGWR
jgi:MinD-like ATPase involved in chromosome partitioning or flagellar assembly